MKLAIVSDLHLEFRDAKEFSVLLDRINGCGADAVVIAGDLHPNKMFRDFFFTGLDLPFVFVMGNHDLYRSTFEECRWTRVLKGGLRVVGATLWTDFGNGNVHALMDFHRIMNDGRLIKPRNKPRVADEMFDCHQRDLAYIISKEADVVVTHHAPSYRSVADKFKQSVDNIYYVSPLDEIIEANPNIKLWVHGHTHVASHYTIGKTEVICNPLGYPTEQAVSDYLPIVVNVS